MTGMELTYAYGMASAVRRDGGGSEVLLGTSGGRTESGPVAHPLPTCRRRDSRIAPYG